MRKIRIDITDEHVDISEAVLPKVVHINAPSFSERESRKQALNLIDEVEKDLCDGYMGIALKKIEDFKKIWGIE
jgi:hypothetical protein